MSSVNIGSNLFNIIALQNLRWPWPMAGLPAFRRQGDNSADDADDGGLWRDVPRDYYRQGARLGRGGLL